MLDESNLNFRLQVVDDGCDSRTASYIDALLREMDSALASPAIHLASNAGKGAAVRAGWSARCGERWLGFVDCDGSVSGAEVLRLAGIAARRPEAVVFGSRIHDPKTRIVRRVHRHRLGRIFAAAVRFFTGLDIHDTQCGLKWVPTTIYAAVDTRLRERRFIFDVELLAVLDRVGVPLIEVPISWVDSGHSTVRLWRDVPSMAIGLLRVSLRLNR